MSGSTLAAGAASVAVAPLPRGAGAQRPGRERELRAIERPATRRRPRRLYGIVAVLGALSIAAAQMVLSIMTTQTSYQLSTLSGKQHSLTLQKQVLYDEVAGLSSPQYLAANASALGMVIDESPSYLRLSDGAILGSSQAAQGSSTIDPLARNAVGNSLIQSTPLVTQPDATIQGVPTPQATTDPTPGAATTDPATPPPLTEGLPSPTTH
jgi:hypothetical protein